MTNAAPVPIFFVFVFSIYFFYQIKTIYLMKNPTKENFHFPLCFLRHMTPSFLTLYNFSTSFYYTTILCKKK